MKDITKRYSKGELTVVWKPKLCIHSEKCFKGLANVFDPNRRPWINLDNADTEAIKEQVRLCPSGALSYDSEEASPIGEGKSTSFTAQILPNGPILIKGMLTVIGVDGKSATTERSTALCRCGLSANKPYCDGSHKNFDFDDQ